MVVCVHRAQKVFLSFWYRYAALKKQLSWNVLFYPCFSLEKTVERSLDKESNIDHDPRVRTCASQKADIQTWPSRSLNPRQVVGETRFGNTGNEMQNTVKMGTSYNLKGDRVLDDNDQSPNNHAGTQRQKNPFPIATSLEHQSGHTGMRINCSNKETISATHRTCPRTDSFHHEISAIPGQNSLTQVILPYYVSYFNLKTKCFRISEIRFFY